MNIPETVRKTLERLEEAGFEAWLVGGCVRDSLMGRGGGDYDICTSARPEETKAVFADCRVIETGIRHGTVTVLWEGLPMEITTFRCDGDYSDGRHPDSVAFTPSLEEDLKRRDFTINAMAWSPRRGLVDLYNGQEDLHRKRIRCVGEAKKRFREDGLRILRAMRFAARFGFEIEYDTAAAMHREAPLLCILSVERVLTELRGILCGKGAAAVVEEFADVLRVVIPELRDTMLPEHAPADFRLRMALLLRDDAEEVLRRLKSDNATLHAVSLLAEGLREGPVQTVPAMRRRLSRQGEENARLLAAVQRTEALLAETLAAGGPFSVRELAIGGGELAALGMEKGPAIGEALQKLLEAVWDEDCPNEGEALLSYARACLLSSPLR